MADAPRPHSVAAPAKINLTLHVTGRREDGYHELDSLVAFAGIDDEVRAEAADGLTLNVEGPQAAKVPAGTDNLVLKAARALSDAAAGLGRSVPGARLTLTKNLPVASGIGGGSADAAAALKALIKLWDLEIPSAALQELALGLGADVPVCLIERAARMSGIGEVVQPVAALPPAWLVLVNPGLALATPDVFAARTGDFSAPAPELGATGDVAAFAAYLKGCRNDLEAPARTLAPVIGDVLEALGACENVLISRMSGSGATCFGLFDSAGQAEMAAQKIRSTHPGWWVEAAPLLD
ncbi:MAG: 4-(cytidine 5'-diphospho)-2-C-methyl-D-erythritol kinase [Rhodospirillales bacterium]|nr:4-(cytidine 5'-diphospho)-2-C-methyl-D-erythritol kinase [Rhodospirillales bacterium]